MCTSQCHDYNCPVREICETYGLESMGIDTEMLMCQGEPYQGEPYQGESYGLQNENQDEAQTTEEIKGVR